MVAEAQQELMRWFTEEKLKSTVAATYDLADWVDAFRLIVGSLMIAAMVLGYLAVRRRDIATHRAWMIRGYAIAMGAGTQGVFFIPWVLLFGQPGVTTYALIMGAAWLTNLAVAETVIRRRKRRAVPL